MAHTSTSRRRFGAAFAALGVTAAAVTALVGLAGPASAHIPKVKADCTDKGTTLKVELLRYNSKGDNTVKITDGDQVLDETTFEVDYKKNWAELDATKEHNFVVEVLAWDDPEGKHGFSFTKELTVKACVQPPTSTTTTEVPTTTEAPTSSSEVVTTTEAPPTSTEVEEAALAETGASIAIPLVIGALLLVGGVVLMFVVRRRSKA